MICENSVDDCLFTENCGDCQNLKLKLEKDLNDILKSEGIDEVNFYQWLFTDRDHKKSITLPSEDFCEKVVNDCFELRKHTFLKEKQDESIKELKANLPRGHIMVFEDYAENYSITHANETQKVKFPNRQSKFKTQDFIVGPYVRCQADIHAWILHAFQQRRRSGEGSKFCCPQ